MAITGAARKVGKLLGIGTAKKVGGLGMKAGRAAGKLLKMGVTKKTVGLGKRKTMMKAKPFKQMKRKMMY